ncbi:MAG TPA: hypothetical protein VGP90_04625, partial [Acidimicrobiia bacterium]|nr:hypothetical protein [Acidimicrobiia bacterium]
MTGRRPAAGATGVHAPEYSGNGTPVGGRRWWLRAGAALAGAIAVGLAVIPVQGKVGPDVAVIDSNAVAASVGLTSRVPAESPGG